MPSFRLAGLTYLCIALLSSSVTAGEINSAVPDRQSFNPTLGQRIVYTVEVASAGMLAVSIVDRDGYVVRQLPEREVVSPGRVNVEWDGRDDAHVIVADEAFSPRVILRTDGGEHVHFPAAQEAEILSPAPQSYDRRNGVLKYTLPSAARVHVQAGVSRVNAASGATDGPVLKTVVNRAPRPAGSVIETWNGYDESGTIYVPDLANFVIAIAATPLPDGSVITTGNRAETFLDTIPRRRGASLLPRRHISHHHAGLTAMEDVAPALVTTTRDAVWSVSDQAWIISAGKFDVDVRLSGANAAQFRALKADVMVFIDQRRVAVVRAGGDPMRIPLTIPTDRAESIVAINWVTDHGPVAVTAFKVRRRVNG